MGRAGADGPELVAGSDDAREMRMNAVCTGYEHEHVSTKRSRDRPEVMGVMGQTQHSNVANEMAKSGV